MSTNTLKLLVLRGLQASGKSTFARNLVKTNPDSWVRASKDDLRVMLYDGQWTRNNEKTTVEIESSIITQALLNHKNVVVDNTHGYEPHLTRLQDLAVSLTARASFPATVEVEIKLFDTPLHVCLDRDSKRDKPVGVKAITETYEKYFKKLLSDTPFINDSTKPRCIVSDLDGTLFLLNGRNPFDASTCDRDPLNTPVANAIRAYQQHWGLPLILLSGRENKYRTQTETALAKHGIESVGLFMRTTGDNRPDYVIKEELYKTHILPEYYVDVVFDDRDQVVNHMRSLGLTVFQVAPGNF